MNLPPEFISNIRNVFKERGDAFLAALPESIAQASRKWGLTNVEPVPTLSYNFVAFATCASSWLHSAPRQVVLKMGVPNRELLSEIEALRLFHGEGACKLIDFDEDNHWMLLERLQPGDMLITVKDDDEATRTAAEVMKKIWRPVEQVTLRGSDTGPDPQVRGGSPLATEILPGTPFGPQALRGETADQPGHCSSARMTDPNRFIPLSDWFDGLKKLRVLFNGGTGPLDEKVVQRVERWVHDAFTENHRPVLMHGDFHHYNILSSERGWLVIDPKGVIGPAGYEVGPLLMNPWKELLTKNNSSQITRRRIAILHEHLGFEGERILEWALAHAVLSAWWSMDDHIEDEYSVRFAEMIASLDIK